MGQQWEVLKERKYEEFTPYGAHRVPLGCAGKLYCDRRRGSGGLVKPTDITSRTHLRSIHQTKTDIRLLAQAISHKMVSEHI